MEETPDVPILVLVVVSPVSRTLAGVNVLLVVLNGISFKVPSVELKMICTILLPS